MLPIIQTVVGGHDAPPEKQGNCFSACICSILEIDINSVDSPAPGLPMVEWEAGWLEILMPYGYWTFGIEINPDDEMWYASPGYWIAAVPSLNIEGVRHAVVMKGEELAHDPSPNKTYKEKPDKILAATYIIPLDPAIK